MAKRVFILAGEASGDAHAAELIRATHAINKSIEFFGIGGDDMRHEGADIFMDYKDIAVVGLVEVLKVLPLLRHTYKKIEEIFKTNKPDMVVLVDYPGFNLRIAKLAKKYGIKVFYFISPQIWAWKKRRINTIRDNVDHMAVILPFEVDVYKNSGIPVTFAGNPSAEAIKPELSKAESLKFFNLDKTKKTIALIPGSRKKEVERMLPVYIESAKLLHNKIPNLQFTLNLAPSIDIKLVQTQLKQHHELDIKLITEKRFSALQLADAAIVTSGTATLETALLGVPLAIAYKLSGLTYFIGKLLIRHIKFIGLCNLIADKEIAPEFIQQEAKPELLADYISKIINDKDFAKLKKSELKALKKKLPGITEVNKLGQSVNNLLNN